VTAKRSSNLPFPLLLLVRFPYLPPFEARRSFFTLSPMARNIMSKFLLAAAVLSSANAYFLFGMSLCSSAALERF
jgi:hypothetical protein